jgi:uncharacterized tellurite resistance protein B-like protein
MNFHQNFNFLKSISTQASKAIIDLHILIMRCDNRVSLSEQYHTQDIIDLLPWNDGNSKEAYYQQSVAKVRDALSSQEPSRQELEALLQQISNILNNQITTAQLEFLTTMIVSADHVFTDAEAKVLELLMSMQ